MCEVRGVAVSCVLRLTPFFSQIMPARFLDRWVLIGVGQDIMVEEVLGRLCAESERYDYQCVGVTNGPLDDAHSFKM